MIEVACRYIDWRVFKRNYVRKLHFVMKENYKNQGDKKITLTSRLFKIINDKKRYRYFKL